MNFRSIKWKISLMFALCIAAVLTVVCIYQTVSVIYGYKQDFRTQMNKVFTEDYVQELSALADNVNYTVADMGADGVAISTVETDNALTIYQSVWAHYANLGIGPSRYLGILDLSGMPVYCTDNSVFKDGVIKTASVIASLNGNEAVSTSLLQKHCDYALPVGAGGHIVYVYDNGEALYKKAVETLYIYLRCLVLALIFSLLVGIYLAGSVTVPIKRLSDWAKQLASGNYDAKADIPGNDELSMLSDALEDMAENMDNASAEARRDRTKIETILQAMTDGLLAFNTEGELIHYNEEAKRLLGRNYFDDISFDKFFKEINADVKIGDLLYMKAADDDLERHVIIGERFIVMNFKTFNLNDKIAGIVVVLHDTTKQEKLEESRRLFVADVSHELRTPITTIKSYAETLLDSTDNQDDLVKRFVGVIASESDRMARIISDLLTLSSLDDKHASYKIPETIDIRNMISSVVERFQISAKKKNQTIIYAPVNEVPNIMGDADALERVIINIIGNAVKYTPEGGQIEVYSSKVYNDITIKVSDNGIGIAKESLPHIFDRFYRVDKARSRDTGGTGLGLAIAKQTIETSFKGKIKITSEAGKGTEVSITIPVASN